MYTITLIAQTGGSVSGGGAYEPMANATITAAENGGYYFVGWYDEKNELVTAEHSFSLISGVQLQTMTMVLISSVTLVLGRIHVLTRSLSKLSSREIIRLLQQNMISVRQSLL